MKIILRLFALLLVVVIVVFSVNNMDMASVDTWPLQPVSLPIWAIAWIGIVIGLILGFVVAWFSAGKYRKRVRELLRRIENDQRDTAIMRRQIEKMEAAEKQTAIPLPPADAA